MESITIRPDRYRQFGASEGCTFCLVTNSEIVDCFSIEKNGSYADYQTFTYNQEGAFEELLQNHIP